MKVKICDMNQSAIEKLPMQIDDKSGTGVHYVDDYIKPLNTKLEDGTRIKCKCRGLKVILTVGDKSCDGLMRRLAVGLNPVTMLAAALEASQAAGVSLAIEDGGVFLDL